MKQKVVIKVSMNSQKSRSKAMKIAVGSPGVDSASLAGPEKTQIEVTGDGIDSVVLVTQLRSKVGYAELVSVAAVEEKKENNDNNDPRSYASGPTPAAVWSYAYAGGPPHYVYQMNPATAGWQYYNNDPYSCTIM